MVKFSSVGRRLTLSCGSHWRDLRLLLLPLIELGNMIWKGTRVCIGENDRQASDFFTTDANNCSLRRLANNTVHTYFLC